METHICLLVLLSSAGFKRLRKEMNEVAKLILSSAGFKLFPLWISIHTLFIKVAVQLLNLPLKLREVSSSDDSLLGKTLINSTLFGHPPSSYTCGG